MKIRQAYIDISAQSFSSDNSLAILLEKTKRLYAKDRHLLVYMAHDTFKTFHLPSHMNIIDYINEFERLNNQMSNMIWNYQLVCYSLPSFEK